MTDLQKLIKIFKAINKNKYLSWKIKKFDKGFIASVDENSLKTHENISLNVFDHYKISLIKFAFSRRKNLFENLPSYGITINPVKIKINGLNKKLLLFDECSQLFYLGYAINKDQAFYNLLNSELLLEVLNLNNFFDSKDLFILKNDEDEYFLMFKLDVTKAIVIFDKDLIDLLSHLIKNNNIRYADSTELKSIYEYIKKLVANGIGLDFVCRKDFIIYKNTFINLNIGSLNFKLKQASASTNLAYILGKLAAESMINVDTLNGQDISNLNDSIINDILLMKKLSSQLLFLRKNNSLFIN